MIPKLSSENIIAIMHAVHCSQNIGSIEISKARQLAHRNPGVERYAEDLAHLLALEAGETAALRAMEDLTVAAGPNVTAKVSLAVYGDARFITEAREYGI